MSRARSSRTAARSRSTTSPSRGRRSVRGWSPERVAEAAGGRLVAPAPHADGPQRVVIDSRAVGAGDLFVGLLGEQVDGGRFAAQALAAGAWGVLVSPAHVQLQGQSPELHAVIAADDPLVALGSLARAWRRELAAKVVGITGSTGK